MDPAHRCRRTASKCVAFMTMNGVGRFECGKRHVGRAMSRQRDPVRRRAPDVRRSLG
jgi:hypothetical protein